MSAAPAASATFPSVRAFLNLRDVAGAIDFYARAFGAQEQGRLYGRDGVIVHAELLVGDSIVSLAEAVIDPPTRSVCHLHVDDADAWWSRAVDAGARIVMPIENAYWGERFGILEDAWDTRWAVRARYEHVAWGELQRRLDRLLGTAS